MKCQIYASTLTDELYLYLPERDDFERVPEPVMKKMGRPRHVMEVDLELRESLARADPKQIQEDIAKQGFYLQTPPPIEPLTDSLSNLKMH